MKPGRGALTALHLFLVWATMAAVVPMLGFGQVVSAWGGGAGATVPVFALGVPLAVGLLAMAGPADPAPLGLGDVAARFPRCAEAAE